MSYDVNAYKLDSRTEREFIRDLKIGLRNEVDIIDKFRSIIEYSEIVNPSIVYVGSDEEGEIEYENGNIANVDLFPDYLIKYKDERFRIRYKFIEVKSCNPHSKFAFFKVSQLEQFANMDSVVILFVMGYSTNSPRFIVVDPQDILDLDIEPELEYGKPTIKVPVKMFDWERFSIIRRDYNILERDYFRLNRWG